MARPTLAFDPAKTGAREQSYQQRERGDRVDRICRWAVPAGFVGVNALSAAYFLTFH